MPEYRWSSSYSSRRVSDRNLQIHSGRVELCRRAVHLCAAGGVQSALRVVRLGVYVHRRLQIVRGRGRRGGREAGAGEAGGVYGRRAHAAGEGAGAADGAAAGAGLRADDRNQWGAASGAGSAGRTQDCGREVSGVRRGRELSDGESGVPDGAG